MNRKIALLALIASGCQIGPRYDSPEISVADVWKSPQAIAILPQVEDWWDVFQDPQLKELIGQAIGNNPTLLAASHRVEQARDFSKLQSPGSFLRSISIHRRAISRSGPTISAPLPIRRQY